MKNDIDIDIRVPSHTRYLRMIGRIGEEVARETDCPEGIRETLPSLLAIVLTEGVVNAIKHAHSADSEEDLHVRINVSKKDLVVRIYDNGIGFDLDAVPNHSLNSNGLEEKGRGIFIIRSLMDTVKYIRSNNTNVLEMRKSLA
ncbi:MAG: ATP-binding protein [Deltaproteobacteria bacterium]|jgi:serine/threonine-protein kinase RsbW|nr:ATP-binding protein [Deltaproteobacteria bacterium]